MSLTRSLCLSLRTLCPQTSIRFTATKGIVQLFDVRKLSSAQATLQAHAGAADVTCVAATRIDERSVSETER